MYANLAKICLKQRPKSSFFLRGGLAPPHPPGMGRGPFRGAGQVHTLQVGCDCVPITVRSTSICHPRSSSAPPSRVAFRARSRSYVLLGKLGPHVVVFSSLPTQTPPLDLDHQVWRSVSDAISSNSICHPGRRTDVQRIRRGVNWCVHSVGAGYHHSMST